MVNFGEHLYMFFKNNHTKKTHPTTNINETKQQTFGFQSPTSASLQAPRGESQGLSTPELLERFGLGAPVAVRFFIGFNEFSGFQEGLHCLRFFFF